VGPAHFAMTEPAKIETNSFKAILQEELSHDPYSLDILANLMVRALQEHQDREATAAFLQMRKIAPNSVPVREVIAQVQRLAAEQQKQAVDHQ